MNALILRIEDISRASEQTTSLLEGAKTAFLQQLSQAGACGTIRGRPRAETLDRFRLHQGLVGIAQGDPDVSPGHCYAEGANVRLADGETAWCCELVTQRDGIVIDPTAGNIPTKESRILIQALNAQLGSDARRWELGEASRHLLVVRDPALEGHELPSVNPPEWLIGRSWRRGLQKGSRNARLRELIEQAEGLLEAHAINRVRVDLGENPANLIWLWGAGPASVGQGAPGRAGRSGVVFSKSFPLRGLARRIGLEWMEGPRSLQEEPLQRLRQAIQTRAKTAELIYVHLEVDSADPVERLCAMERIDQLVIKPLAEAASEGQERRLLAVIDGRGGLVSFVAIGAGLPQQPIARLTAESFAESPLRFTDSAKLFSWLTS